MGIEPSPAERRPIMETIHERSAGGLVVRGDEILLISLSGGRRWQLPKGHLEEGESDEQAAMREVREETGVTATLVQPLPDIEYWFVQAGQRVHKRVTYYLLDYASGSELDYDPSEVSGAAWFPWEEGITRLSFDNERDVVRTAHAAWQARAGQGTRPPAGAGSEAGNEARDEAGSPVRD